MPGTGLSSAGYVFLFPRVHSFLNRKLSSLPPMCLFLLSLGNAACKKRTPFILTTFRDVNSSLFTVLEECYYGTEENTRTTLLQLKPRAMKAASPI